MAGETIQKIHKKLRTMKIIFARFSVYTKKFLNL